MLGVQQFLQQETNRRVEDEVQSCLQELPRVIEGERVPRETHVELGGGNAPAEEGEAGVRVQ
jgi:hypothetical protein